jgi:hypothetical protein
MGIRCCWRLVGYHGGQYVQQEVDGEAGLDAGRDSEEDSDQAQEQERPVKRYRHLIGEEHDASIDLGRETGMFYGSGSGHFTVGVSPPRSPGRGTRPRLLAGRSSFQSPLRAPRGTTKACAEDDYENAVLRPGTPPPPHAPLHRSVRRVLFERLAPTASVLTKDE